MTVQELITRLARENPDSVVLAGDNDGWYATTSTKSPWSPCWTVAR